MGIVFGIAAVLLLVALSGKKNEAASDKDGKQKDTTQGALPSFVRQIIVNRNASKDDLARAALEAKNAGYPQLAQALAKRITEGKSLITSPWKDVSDGAWTRFARVISNGKKPDDIKTKGFYGMFDLGVRRLVDLGVMRDPVCSTATDPKTGAAIRIWRGQWVMPQEKFLADPKLQYDLFCKSMELYRNIIAEKYKQVLGLDINGQKATLSGLLALAHSCGAEGMYKWLTNPEMRERFTWVTNAYNRANGIF